MNPATLTVPDGWTLLTDAARQTLIAELFVNSGHQILAAARADTNPDVFALLDYRQSGYVADPSLSQINEAELIRKAREDLEMMNEELGLEGQDAVRWKGLALKPRFDLDGKILDYGVELSFGRDSAVNLYRICLCRDGVVVLTVVGTAQDRLSLDGFAVRLDPAYAYSAHNPGRDRIAEGTLANVILMNRFI